MKTFILMILMTDINGNEYLDRVNNITYKDKLHCLADKSFHTKDSMIERNDKQTKSIKYFCADSLLYKAK